MATQPALTEEHEIARQWLVELEQVAGGAHAFAQMLDRTELERARQAGISITVVAAGFQRRRGWRGWTFK